MLPEHTPFFINVIVTTHNEKPCLELRRKTIDQEIIKRLVQSAFYEEPLILVPRFTDKFNSLNSLIKLGVLSKDEGGEYHFNF